ncbi:uncharacterized protein [Neodiprion pinetum]|uniref:uncharacterized protein n=1 Tax=Neodiprion pinetum TaxID=441929 RepID=UPI001EDEE310|nr:uncharacterized protein LOC124219884 [Neodiprion pinetum]XP_046484064.1 uncharacterized protein LOC124219884 [Neodiprion pinetum]XP_046484065.1 uncharacterized protein LOC124219884 [Neodiprion pinetum]
MNGKNTVMEEKSQYVSCIKINGVPILPPLMTDDLRAEMSYYKQLAIAVEEKLKMLKIAKESIRTECAKCIALENQSFKTDEKVEKSNSYDSTTEDSCMTETETSTIESGPNIDTVIDIPTREEQPDKNYTSLDTSFYESTAETMNQSDASFDNDGNENSSKERNDELFTTSTCSDTITASTDLNQYLDASPPTQSTVETVTPEIVKPKVPKTLDIIPITVQVPEREKSDDSFDEKPSGQNTPPKLVRQGSYILEAPSPMLLAHMQTELADPGYIPSTTSTAIKRKEWNISQAKSEWENQIKNKEIIIPDNSRGSNGHTRYRRNSMSTLNNQKVFKSLSHAKNGSSLGMHQSAKSVDCIQTMLDRELVCKSPGGAKSNGYSQMQSVRGSGGSTKSGNSQKFRSNRNVSFINLANRLGGSVGSLVNFGGQSCQAMNARNDRSKPTIINEAQSTPSPVKSVAVTDKLVIIFKEIQRKHEEQMAELIAKQQREQKNMQREFEKQQALLLGQIKKTFPGILIPPTAEEETPEVLKPVLNTTKEDDDTYSLDKNNPPLPKCPLDYIYPLNGHCETIISSSNNTSTHPKVDTSENKGLESNELLSKNIDAPSSIHRSKNTADKCLNVSRQLFPLDSNTVHVPIPVNVHYTAKHIKAATIINAYARGYLVRRLMNTERVVDLKNTYKEALHCMLKLHVDAPLNLPELNFHQRLQLQCDAASMNIAELFAQSPEQRMQVISQDRDIKRSRSERPSSAHSYSFATQRTLARKKMKEMGNFSSPPISSRTCSARSRCQTWTSNSREKRSQNIYHGIKRSTSAGTVRKPWR